MLALGGRVQDPECPCACWNRGEAAHMQKKTLHDHAFVIHLVQVPSLDSEAS